MPDPPCGAAVGSATQLTQAEPVPSSSNGGTDGEGEVTGMLRTCSMGSLGSLMRVQPLDGMRCDECAPSSGFRDQPAGAACTPARLGVVRSMACQGVRER